MKEPRRFRIKYLVTYRGCWIWTAAKRKGYGVYWQNGGNVPAHRISYEIFNGAIPEGKMVLHHCDTPACVNPDHLFTGDAKDNTQDMIAKGRHKYGYRARYGDDNHASKLNAPKVRAIRALYKFGHGWSQTKLAREFGVSQAATSALINHKTWADV